jgi:hypothetical protein
VETSSKVISSEVPPAETVYVPPTFISGQLISAELKLHGTSQDNSTFPSASVTVSVVPASTIELVLYRIDAWVDVESNDSAIEDAPQAMMVPPVISATPPLSLA